MKRTQIYLSEQQHELLRRMAFEQRKSISQVIRDVVDQLGTNAKSRGDATFGSASDQATKAKERESEEAGKEAKREIGEVLKSSKIEKAKEITESLKGLVSEERYQQLTNALEEYRKSLEKLSKYS